MRTIREILFKAKLKDWKTNPQQNKWVEGYYLSKKETTYCFTEDYEKNPVKTLYYIAVDSMTDWGLPNEFRCFEIDPDTLCQFIDLIDNNNNKIWENDIVRLDEDNYIIAWDEYDAMFVLSNNYVINHFGNVDNKWCEVIGNQFDNSELLKGE